MFQVNNENTRTTSWVNVRCNYSYRFYILKHSYPYEIGILILVESDVTILARHLTKLYHCILGLVYCLENKVSLYVKNK